MSTHSPGMGNLMLRLFNLSLRRTAFQCDQSTLRAKQRQRPTGKLGHWCHCSTGHYREWFQFTFVVLDTIDDFVGTCANNRNILQVHVIHALLQPFDTTFHGLNECKRTIRHACCRNDSRETATTANIGNGLCLASIGDFPNERDACGGVEDMTFPDDGYVAWAYQSTQLTLAG